MGTQIFLGEPPANIKQWIIDHAVQDFTSYKAQTTSSYKKTGIYSATRDDTSEPVVIDWGDGTVEEIDGKVSKKVHEYSTVGEFTVKIKNIKTFAASSNDFIWYHTTSQNRYTFKELVSLNNAVTSIGYCAFYNCSGLTSVTIGNGVTSIGENAFEGCSTSLYDTATIPGVRLVDGWAVGYTDSLSGNLNLTGIRGIGWYAFHNCSGLTSITIPDSVTSIGNYAFEGCSNLIEYYMPGFTVDDVKANALNWGLGTGEYEWIAFLVVVYCSDGVVVINDNSGSSSSDDGSSSGGGGGGDHADTWYKYAGDTEWRTVSISGEIEGDTYEGTPTTQIPDVTNVVELEIGSDVTSIENYAFSQCRSLTSVTIPNSVINIGEGVFYNCDGLTNVAINSFTKNEIKSMTTNDYIFGEVFYDDEWNPIEKTFTAICTDGSMTVHFSADEPATITFTDL